MLLELSPLLPGLEPLWLSGPSLFIFNPCVTQKGSFHMKPLLAFCFGSSHKGQYQQPDSMLHCLCRGGWGKRKLKGRVCVEWRQEEVEVLSVAYHSGMKPCTSDRGSTWASSLRNILMAHTSK